MKQQNYKILINAIRKFGKIRLSVILGSGIRIANGLIRDRLMLSQGKGGVHNKKIYLGKIRDNNLLIFQGRKHYYEGYGYDDIVNNSRIAVESGSQYVLITNAAGGINQNLEVGDLMLITSYINFNPMLKVPAVRLSSVNNFNQIIAVACQKAGINFKTGTYCYCSGPQFETNAEIKFHSKIGTDAVGMSTLPEIYELNRNGVKVSAISCITNVLKPYHKISTTHDDVLDNAGKCSLAFSKLLDTVLYELK